MKRIVAKNALVITLGSLALKAINFIYNTAVIRQLGDDRFGQLSMVTAFVGLFSIFAELGVSQYVMREIAQRPEKTKLLFWNLIALRLTLAIIGVIGITAMAAVFGFREQLLLGVLLYTLTVIYSAFLAPLDTLVVAAERFEYQTAMLVVGQIATVLLGAVVLINNWGVRGADCGGAAGYVSADLRRRMGSAAASAGFPSDQHCAPIVARPHPRRIAVRRDLAGAHHRLQH